MAEQDDGDELIECPACGEKEFLDGYDVIGADPGCIFCTACHCEFDGDGVIVPVRTEAHS